MAFDPFTKEDFLRIWRAVLPSSYTDPIETEGETEGFDVPSLQAKIFADYDIRLNRSQQAYFLKPHSIQTDEEAKSGRKATGEVEVSRLAPTLGDLPLAVGTKFLAVIKDSYGDRLIVNRYLSTAAVTLDEGSTGPFTVPVEAEFDGYVGNIVAELVSEFEELGRANVPVTVTAVNQITERVIPTEANDSFSDQMIGRFMLLSSGSMVSENRFQPRLITNVTGDVVTFTPSLDDATDVGLADVFAQVVELEDLGLSVVQPVAITGGRTDALGAIATDRGTGRNLGETDVQFRDRLCALDDIISPAAICDRIIPRILAPFGIPFECKETRDINGLMGFTWDVHPFDFGQIGTLLKPGGSEYVGQGGVWLSESWLVRAFIICVGFGNQGEFGFAYDALNPQATAPNAYDLSGGLGGFYDGSPVGYNAIIGQVWQAVNDARAAGVKFIIVRDPNLV